MPTCGTLPSTGSECDTPPHGRPERDMSTGEGPLSGRAALVTGATRNLGRAAAIRLAQDGADIAVMTQSSPEAACELADELRGRHGVRACVVTGDVGDSEQIRAAVASARAELGSVDIAVQCAAVRPHSPLLSISTEEWESVLRTNLSSAFHFAQALLPHMIDQGWGRIVHVGGVDGWVGWRNRAHNVAAKAGLHGLTKALALEVGQHAVTVNTLVPGVFLGPRDPASYPGWDDAEMAARVPVGRQGDAMDDFAEAVAYLVRDSGSFVTGQALHLNGGQWMF